MLNKLRGWAVPLGLLIVLVISFGLLIPWLGFYWDDWSVMLTARMRGVQGFWEYYQYDRPVSAWTLAVAYPILGMSPVAWHIFTLLLRWGTTLGMWWTLLGLWPQRRREVTLAAFLFAIYPIFTQQAISVAYSQHWTCYLLFCLSTGLMVWAWRKPKYAGLFTLLGVATAVVQVFTMEYFAGLELLRPIMLWILASEQCERAIDRIRMIVWRWLPYLFGFAAFVLWRLFFLKLPVADPNTPSLLFQLTSAPVHTISHLLELALQDLAFMIITVWAAIFKAENIQILDRFVLASWAAAILAAAGMIILLPRMLKQEPANFDEKRWPLQAVGLGGAGMILGVLPIWLTDRQVMTGLFSDRFGLPAMFGASILVVGLICWLTPSAKKQILLVSILVGICTGQHIRTENDFRWAWVNQTRFYWQLSWRAPAIQPHSSIFSDGEFFSYMGRNATGSAIDVLYPPAGLPLNELPYYFYSLGRDFSYQMPEFLKGMAVHEQNYRIFHFNGSTKDGLIVHYDPIQNSCLHVMTPEDADTPGLPAITAQALPNANLSLIKDQPDKAGYPQTFIFGPEPKHDWCYLYQKAALAQQKKDWAEVVKLGDQARARGYQPKAPESNTAYEWLAFIDGYAHTGQWQTAQNLSFAAFERDKRIDARMCRLWDQISAETAASDSRDAASTSVREKLSCP